MWINAVVHNKAATVILVIVLLWIMKNNTRFEGEMNVLI